MQKSGETYLLGVHGNFKQVKKQTSHVTRYILVTRWFKSCNRKKTGT